MNYLLMMFASILAAPGSDGAPSNQGSISAECAVAIYVVFSEMETRYQVDIHEYSHANDEIDCTVVSDDRLWVNIRTIGAVRGGHASYGIDRSTMQIVERYIER